MKALYLSAVATSMMLLSGCAADDAFRGQGEGRVLLRTSLNGDFDNVGSRAGDEVATEAELRQSGILWISNGQGVVRRYTNFDQIPADVMLVAGHYTAEAWAGDSVPASWTKRWFKGVEEFDVQGNSISQVDITCQITNVGARVVWSDQAKAALQNPLVTLTVKASKATDRSLVYTPDETRRGYFMMPKLNSDRQLEYTITGTTADGAAFTKTGEIDNAKAATEYVLNINYNSSPEVTVGGGYFDIVVDENPMGTVETSIDIKTAPLIEGDGFNLRKNMIADEGTFSDMAVIIGSHGELKTVNIGCDRFTSDLGLQADNFSLLDPTFMAYGKQQLESEGISYKYVYDPVNDASAMKIVFAASLLNKMKSGMYSINFNAIDDENRASNATWDITIGAYPAGTIVMPENSPAVWATSATIEGVIDADGVEAAGFNYRKAGAADWSYMPAVGTRAAYTVGQTFYAELTGLTPGTVYEYCAVADGQASPKIGRFTTEAAAQLPNNSFENWWQDGNVLMPNAQNGEQFWDSGNHGSTTLGADYNITKQETSIVHSGSTALRMVSQNILIKFAAGNVFVGEYLATDGTNGILGFGRPFTSRPKAVTVWVKYTPGKIVYPSRNFPSVPGLEQNATDQGSIICTVFNSTLEHYVCSKGTYDKPAIVHTAAGTSGHYFDPEKPNVDNVVGFGKLYLDKVTQSADGGLVQVTVPITYKKNEKAAYISIAFAASRWGDYFAGGDSEMIIDDVQLVY